MIRALRKTICLLVGLAFCLPMSAVKPDTIRIVFIGDVMSHGPQTAAALRPGGNRANPADYDYSSYFRHVQDRFDAADFVVANLEFPCGVKPYSGYPFFSAPQSLAYEAQRCGIDLFLAANNHICDQGRAGSRRPSFPPKPLLTHPRKKRPRPVKPVRPFAKPTGLMWKPLPPATTPFTRL